MPDRTLFVVARSFDHSLTVVALNASRRRESPGRDRKGVAAWPFGPPKGMKNRPVAKMRRTKWSVEAGFSTERMRDSL
jgi:hypothetical protein